MALVQRWGLYFLMTIHVWEMDDPFSVGRYVPTASEKPMEAMAYWTLKRLWEFGTTPWVVVGSCNGTSFNMGGSNLITSRFDIKGASPSSNHTWIVYQNPFNGSQFCFDFDRSSGTYTTFSSIYCSPSGLYTGGSTTNRPSATDEFRIVDGPAWSIFAERETSFPNTTARIFLLRTQNGESTRLLVNPNSKYASLICMDTTSRKIPNFNGIIGAHFKSNAQATFDVGDYWTTSNNNTFSAYLPNSPHIEDLVVGTTLSTKGISSRQRYGETNQASGKILIKPMTLHAIGSANNGFVGFFEDLWMQDVAFNLQTHNKFYIDESGNQLLFFGSLLLPWPKEHKYYT